MLQQPLLLGASKDDRESGTTPSSGPVPDTMNMDVEEGHSEPVPAKNAGSDDCEIKLSPADRNTVVQWLAIVFSMYTIIGLRSLILWAYSSTNVVIYIAPATDMHGTPGVFMTASNIIHNDDNIITGDAYYPPAFYYDDANLAELVFSPPPTPAPEPEVMQMNVRNGAIFCLVIFASLSVCHNVRLLCKSLRASCPSSPTAAASSPAPPFVADESGGIFHLLRTPFALLIAAFVWVPSSLFVDPMALYMSMLVLALLIAFVLKMVSMPQNRLLFSMLCVILVFRTWVPWDLPDHLPVLMGAPLGFGAVAFMDPFIREVGCTFPDAALTVFLAPYTAAFFLPSLQTPQPHTA